MHEKSDFYRARENSPLPFSGKENLPQVFFFKTELLEDPIYLSLLFAGYNHYIQETIWLLQQQLFEKMCRYAPNVKSGMLEQTRTIQRRAFEAGKQVDFGEIAIQTYLFDAKQVYSVLQKMGVAILFCNTCKQYFKAASMPGKLRYNCPESGSPLEKNVAEEKFIMQALRVGFGSLRPLVSRGMRPHDHFLFLDMPKQPEMDLFALDHKINSALQEVYQWVTAPDSANELTANMFWLYVQNVQELLWLFSQKIFGRFCLIYQYLTPSQLKQALSIQQRAFQENRQFHLGEVALQAYLLQEEQIYFILGQLGIRILLCQSCNQYFLQLAESEAERSCLRCNSFLKDVFPKYETLVDILRINPSQPVLLSDAALVPHNLFSFFCKRGYYVPGFTLSGREMEIAFRSFYEPLSHPMENMNRAQPLEPVRKNFPLETPIPEVINWEIDQMMDSIAEVDAKTTEEEIYGSGESLRPKTLLPGPPIALWDEVSLVPKTPKSVDRMATTREIRHLMDSIAKIDAETTEEEIYDLKESLDIEEAEETLRVPRKGTQEIRLRMESPTALEPCPAPSKKHHRSAVLLLGIAIAFACVAALLYQSYRLSREMPKSSPPHEPQSSNKQLPEAMELPTPVPEEHYQPPEKEDGPTGKKEGDQEQVDVEDAITVIEDKLREPDQNAPKAPLESLLQDGADTAYIARELGKLIHQNALSAKDIPLLKQLYRQYEEHHRLKSLAIQAIGKIGGREALPALEEIFHNSLRNPDKIVVIEALQEAGKESKFLLLQILETEKDAVASEAARALSTLAPKDEEIYQNLKSKFYRISADEHRKVLLQAMSTMDIAEQNSFFIKIAGSANYGSQVRIEAIDALIEDSAGNASMYLPDLTQMERREKGALRDKIQEAIEALSE